MTKKKALSELEQEIKACVKKVKFTKRALQAYAKRDKTNYGKLDITLDKKTFIALEYVTKEINGKMGLNITMADLAGYILLKAVAEFQKTHPL